MQVLLRGDEMRMTRALPWTLQHPGGCPSASIRPSGREGEVTSEVGPGESGRGTACLMRGMPSPARPGGSCAALEVPSGAASGVTGVNSAPLSGIERRGPVGAAPWAGWRVGDGAVHEVGSGDRLQVWERSGVCVSVSA